MSNLALRLSERARSRLISGETELEQALDSVMDEVAESSPQQLETGTESSIREQVRAQLRSLGPLQPLLDDPEIEEIWINEAAVFIAKSGIASKTELEIPPELLSTLVEKMLRETGRRVDRSSPFVDASLPDGSRLHVVIPDITRSSWSVNIRKFPKQVLSLQNLVGLGSLSSAQANYLASQVVRGKNILVSGATQAGKTTMLCALLDEVSQRERIITVEETFEIRTRATDWVAMQTRAPNLEGVGEINLRRLVKEALRMRPGRIVVGEVREAESFDLLIALNSGLPGLCTIHANSASDAVAKLCTLPLLAGANISSSFVNPTVASCIDLVVHCRMLPSGKRVVQEIVSVQWDGKKISLGEVQP